MYFVLFYFPKKCLSLFIAFPPSFLSFPSSITHLNNRIAFPKKYLEAIKTTFLNEQRASFHVTFDRLQLEHDNLHLKFDMHTLEVTHDAISKDFDRYKKDMEAVEKVEGKGGCSTNSTRSVGVSLSRMLELGD